MPDHRVRAGRERAVELMGRAIARELDARLRAILGYAEITQGLLPKDSLAHGNLEKMVAGSRRAADLVQRFRRFFPTLPDAPKTHDIARIVRESIPVLEHLAGKGIRLELPGQTGACLARVSRGEFEHALTLLVAWGRAALEGRGRFVFSCSDSPPCLAVVSQPEQVGSVQEHQAARMALESLEQHATEMDGRLEVEHEPSGPILRLLLPLPDIDQ